QKPHSFEKATAPVDAENWISHMEKIFDVMGCEDAFKTRLAVYKFEGDALAWWKAYKQAKCGDERLKREYHSIRQTDTETSTEFMQRFLRLAGFFGAYTCQPVTKRVGINSFSSFFTTVNPPFLDSFQAIARLWDFKSFIRVAFSSSPNSLAMMTGNLLSPSRKAYSRWGGRKDLIPVNQDRPLDREKR
nr:hypothetical protein [Tanacetum cinerariifolium]